MCIKLLDYVIKINVIRGCSMLLGGSSLAYYFGKNNETTFKDVDFKYATCLFFGLSLYNKKKYGYNFEFLMGANEKSLSRYGLFLRRNHIQVKPVNPARDDLTIYKNTKLLPALGKSFVLSTERSFNHSSFRHIFYNLLLAFVVLFGSYLINGKIPSGDMLALYIGLLANAPFFNCIGSSTGVYALFGYNFFNNENIYKKINFDNMPIFIQTLNNKIKEEFPEIIGYFNLQNLSRFFLLYNIVTPIIKMIKLKKPFRAVGNSGGHVVHNVGFIVGMIIYYSYEQGKRHASIKIETLDETKVGTLTETEKTQPERAP